MNRCIFRFAILILLCFSTLFACLPKSKAPQPVYYYTLDYTSARLKPDTQLPVVIRVDRFSVSPPYNSKQIIYADKDLHRNTYPNFQWIASPGELLAYLLTRDLRQTKAFKAILTPDAASTATHSLMGWVEEFLEKDDPAIWKASLVLHITLMDLNQSNPGKSILMQKTYSASAPCRQKKPAALALAMSQAMASVSKKIIADSYSILEAQLNKFKRNKP
ncbi:MAG: hypothetical protein GY874_02990 [Desulfobacteraceae bacterium]|nr:hypothetical protein [Desulfobacteraceae bacterium]